MPSDVTAVVLSIGEPFVDRALASLAEQTSPPAAIVRVDGVSPFHRALNRGIESVRTEYFVHVDADMILDRDALADLRACMAAGVAAAIGGLRDPLLGSIVGIKLYRTECARAEPCPDTISPAVDFLTSMLRRGWVTAHAIKYRPGPATLWHTFGRHEPDYSPPYTFYKFRLLGARYRHWRNGISLRRMFAKLGDSSHTAALYAQTGLACGVFWSETRDALVPAESSGREFETIRRLLERERGSTRTLGGGGDLRGPFFDGYRAAREVVRDESLSLRAEIDSRRAPWSSSAAWMGFLGLCAGLLPPARENGAAEADFDGLMSLFPDGVPD